MLSFEKLYVAYSPDVYRFAYWISGNAADAEDITSETFFRAWMNFNAIRTETLKAYLFTIARNIYLESLRNHHPDAELKDEIPDQQPQIENRLDHESDLAVVRKILQAVPEVDRSAFVMRVQYDLPYEEIARVLQLSETTVKVKVHRVRKRLFKIKLKKEIS
jgi:RNA polymerase sigma-70 factor, ECF subfamily